MENIVDKVNTNDYRRRARRMTIILGICIFLTLISVLYGLVQQTEARRQESLANERQEEVLKLRIQLVEIENRAKEQMALASKSAEEAFAQKLAVDVVNNQLQLALKELNKHKAKK